MGFRVADTCYATNAEALDAYYSSVAPAQAVGATGTYNTFTNVAGVWKMSQYSISSGGVWTLRYSTNAPVLDFGSCQVVGDATTQFFDGVTLGWGVAAAMVAAWAIKFLADRLK